MEEFDDPYNFLAVHIISICTEMEIHRTLLDDEFIYRMLKKEVRGQDFRGPFVDAIFCDMLEHKHRMKLMRELDKLSDFLFEQLNLEHLRDRIEYYAKRLERIA